MFNALLVIWVIYTCSTFYVCIVFSMDPLRSEIKLYYYSVNQDKAHTKDMHCVERGAEDITLPPFSNSTTQ